MTEDELKKIERRAAQATRRGREGIFAESLIESAEFDVPELSAEIRRLRGVIAAAQDALPKIIVTRTGEMKGYDKLHDLLSAALPGTDKENPA